MEKNTNKSELEKIELDDELSELVTGGSVTMDKVRDSEDEENERKKSKIDQ